MPFFATFAVALPHLFFNVPPCYFIYLKRPFIEGLRFFHQAHYLIVSIPTDVFSWTRPEEFINTIVMHAVDLYVVILFIHDDARVVVIIIFYHTPTANMVNSNDFWSPRSCWNL